MNYLSAENLSKSYGEKILFEELNFGFNKGEKVALIANNGTGKTTLLRILSGKEVPDSGEVTMRDGVKVAFLEQEPELNGEHTIDEMIYSGDAPVLEVIRSYEKAVQLQDKRHDYASQKALEEAMHEMDHKNAWDYERRMKQLLSLFRITETSKKVGLLSGGEKKRLALALVLLAEPEFLILDEPTNHLDIDMIEWLEKYLSQSNLTLLMVTHDRYFLDRVCNHILEMSNGQLYHHLGNYGFFLLKKSEREEVAKTETDKARQLMKIELEWLRRQPKARTHKSKSRIDAFVGIKEKATGFKSESDLKLQVKTSRLGGKSLELENISKRFDKINIVNDFSYLFKKGDRIGIVGRNGSGKTSFLNLITGIEKPDKGKIEKGETVVFGYYRQSGINFQPAKRVIDVVKEIAEVVKMGDGSTISASQFLDHFMFPPETQYKPVGKLSGGELRRLNLLTVLIKNPNFLLLDEPTNDLDLLALNKLEEFLSNFTGCLVLVSHDRYFLDKLSEHIFIFEGDGKVRDYYGSYTSYRQKIADKKQEKEPMLKEKSTVEIKKEQKAKPKTKLTYNEMREYEQLELEIPILEKEKVELEKELNMVSSDYEALSRITTRISELIELIDTKTIRWMELGDWL
jgi:ATP-binding cassette subfamily F protein uup